MIYGVDSKEILMGLSLDKMLIVEKENVERDISDHAIEATSCPCGFLVQDVCHYGAHAVKVWVIAKERDREILRMGDIIAIEKFSMAIDGISISSIRNCPVCETVVGFRGDTPFIVPGFRHVISSIGGRGRLERFEIDGDDSDDSNVAFEWDDEL